MIDIFGFTLDVDYFPKTIPRVVYTIDLIVLFVSGRAGKNRCQYRFLQ